MKMAFGSAEVTAKEPNLLLAMASDLDLEMEAKKVVNFSMEFGSGGNLNQMVD